MRKIFVSALVMMAVLLCALSQAQAEILDQQRHRDWKSFIVTTPDGAIARMITRDNGTMLAIDIVPGGKYFIKLLESALRFGSILIVQDVENADPVLNPLLNKEFHKEGGRTLIRLGDQDIDFSPSFNLFLTTRDSSHQFPPDLCSRVTFVNFTMTLSSLQDQCLNIILQKEAPELYSRRNDLLQLQGEYQARLRDLEEQLLISLSSVQGNILDNDNVMNSMEQLKHEAQTITYEISQSDAVMNSIRESSCIYQPLSQTCSRLYFVLESLHHVFFLYRYNLHFFLDILHAVLNSSENSSPSQSARVI